MSHYFCTNVWKALHSSIDSLFIQYNFCSNCIKREVFLNDFSFRIHFLSEKLNHIQSSTSLLNFILINTKDFHIADLSSQISQSVNLKSYNCSFFSVLFLIHGLPNIAGVTSVTVMKGP